MAMCNACRQEMKYGVGCTLKTLILKDGNIYSRSTEHFNEPDGFCHDCKAPHGEYHHLGCDVERCPRCGGQLISCDCLED